MYHHLQVQVSMKIRLLDLAMKLRSKWTLRAACSLFISKLISYNNLYKNVCISIQQRDTVWPFGRGARDWSSTCSLRVINTGLEVEWCSK